MISPSSLAVTDDRRWVVPSLAPLRERVSFMWARFITAHRQRRILGLIALLWLFSAFDLVLTLWADRFTLFYEANPIARALLAHGMIKSVVLLKVATLTAGSALFWATRHRRPTEGVLWSLVAAYVVLMFQWSAYTANADELAHSRQLAEFAATPVEQDPIYLNCKFRARYFAEQAAAATQARPPAHGHAPLLTVAHDNRDLRPWFRW